MTNILLALGQGFLEGIVFGLMLIMILLFAVLIKEFMRYV